MAKVTLQNIQKVYPGNIQAVTDFSLDIEDGRFIVLVGPSGCGKSTTLRMIAGLEDITSGIISIADRIVNDVHPKDRNIAMVFQNYALYPHMTVYKNMAFALKLRGIPKAEIDDRVRNAAAILGIDDLLNRKPKALSGGQRQRVALGRAIVREPKAFLFDEPLSNLDAKLRVTMRAELKALHLRLKTTTIYVTHDQEEAMTLGDRIVVMSNGLIQQVDTPLNVYNKPANRFVGAFIGTPPMNFLEGTLIQESGLWFVPDALPQARLQIAQAHRAKLDPHTNNPIVMGLRPQAIRLSEKGVFNMTIHVVEPLGDQMDIFLDSNGSAPLIARTPASADITPGTNTQIQIDMNAVHFFEPGQFGQNLLLTPEPAIA